MTDDRDEMATGDALTPEEVLREHRVSEDGLRPPIVELDGGEKEQR